MNRTLGVTLLVMAAIAASLTLARQRTIERLPDPDREPGAMPPTLDADLDAIRSAGL
jgi:hypothetical protein